jgi:hypothetical protein
MRRKPKPQNRNVKINAPTATAPMYAGSGRRPTTAVSTRPSSGVDTFESKIGSASARMARRSSAGAAAVVMDKGPGSGSGRRLVATPTAF